MVTFRKKQRTKLCIGKQGTLLQFSKKEMIILVMKSIGVVLLLNYFFYRSAWAMIPLGFLGWLYLWKESRELLRKKKEQVREEFKELLLLTSTLQKAGYSIENAFADSYTDMERLFGKNCVICRMLKQFAVWRKNHDSFGELWKLFGDELEIPEIAEFAEIYELSYHHSGNMIYVMEQTIRMIIRKTEMKKEIHLSLAQRRLEMRIMTCMPFLIIQYIRMTSPDYFASMYHSLFGVVVMTVALLIYLFAYLWALTIIYKGDRET